MTKKLNIGFVSFSGNAKGYRNAVDKFDNLTFSGVYFPKDDNSFENYSEHRFENYQDLLDASDIILFFSEKAQRKLIIEAIRNLKHILIDDYTCILNETVVSLCNFVDEAEITAQVAMPKLYYWGICEIIETYKNIRYIHFDKSIDYSYRRPTVDIIPEILAIIKLADSEVVSLHNKNLPLPVRKSELLQINLEFLNGISASIKANPCAFYDNRELTIIAEKNIALIDLRKREWHNLVYKTITAEPVKELFTLDEVPFIERNELKNLINSITTKTDPFISPKSIRSLWKCIKMMNVK
ncbi:MAG: hypothetical protein LBP63_03455 [Prevotellaceae bacterium]|jgi:hypothetical protein|nr:hypothetical protein [Prevotellaceae bacterium]